MPKLKIAAAAFLLGWTAPASAEAWWLIDQGEAGFTFVDSDSVRSAGQQRTVWMQVILNRPGQGGLLSTRAQWTYDCARETQTLLAYNAYGERMALIESRTLPRAEHQVDAVAPETIAASALQFVCAGDEERNGLPFAFFLSRPPEDVAGLIPRIRALGAPEREAAFLVAFNPAVIEDRELREGYYEVLRDSIPENNRAAAARLLGVEVR